MNGKKIISDFEYMEGGTFECYPPLFCDATTSLNSNLNEWKENHL